MIRALLLALLLAAGCATSADSGEYVGRVAGYETSRVAGEIVALVTVEWDSLGAHNRATVMVPFGSREYVLFREVGTCVRVRGERAHSIRLAACRRGDQAGLLRN